MKLLEALKKESRGFPSTYSLFHCSGKGDWTFLFKTAQAEEMVARFKSEAIRPETVGLEVRCNGMTVKFDGA